MPSAKNATEPPLSDPGSGAPIKRRDATFQSRSLPSLEVTSVRPPASNATSVIPPLLPESARPSSRQAPTDQNSTAPEPSPTAISLPSGENATEKALSGPVRAATSARAARSPDPHAAVEPCRRHELAVGAEVDVAERDAGGEASHHGAGTDISHHAGSLLIHDCEAASVAAERHARADHAIGAERLPALAVRNAPDGGPAVAGGRDESPTRPKGERIHATKRTSKLA